MRNIESAGKSKQIHNHLFANYLIKPKNFSVNKLCIYIYIVKKKIQERNVFI